MRSHCVYKTLLTDRLWLTARLSGLSPVEEAALVLFKPPDRPRKVLIQLCLRPQLRASTTIIQPLCSSGRITGRVQKHR